MPSFFSNSISKTLTEQSGHYIDWSRVGELIASGRHRYTWQELVQRGFVIASAVCGAQQGYQHAGPDRGLNVTSGLYSMAGCFVGFVVSHIIVIAPLLYKRHQLHQQCDASQERIANLLNALRDIDSRNDHITVLIKQIGTVVDAVMNLSLSDNKHARASQTWGKRKALLEKIEEKLNADMDAIMSGVEPDPVLAVITAFWSQGENKLYSALSDYTPPDYRRHLKVE